MVVVTVRPRRKPNTTSNAFGVERKDSLTSRQESSGKVGWWFRPPWNKKKDRPSVLDAERLMRRHREQIQRLLSKWARNEGNTEGDAA
jgi:hypothetical protein